MVGTSNFFQGAWLVIVLVPILMLILAGINRHYRDMDRALALDHIPEAEEVAPRPIVIVPIARLDRPARQAIAFANSISSGGGRGARHQRPRDGRRNCASAGRSGQASTELVVVESPYRALIGPLLAYMDALQRQAPDRPILVVLQRVRAEALVGEPPPQPDRAPPEAAPLHSPQHDRGGRAFPPGPGLRRRRGADQPLSDCYRDRRTRRRAG